MAPLPLTPMLEILLDRRDVPGGLCEQFMTAVMNGEVPPATLGAMLIAWRAKGESAGELAALAGVMRAHAVPIAAPPGTLDTCGTGGDKSATFNISTAAALVAAGMGIPIAKHGGRSVSSTSGSADVLKALGVNVDAPPAVIERCIRDAGIGFMFAPNHHPGMKHVAPVRRELGVRTVFNLLGPLSNPARTPLQLLGVCERRLCEIFPQVLKQLGSTSAMVVCGTGTDGGILDEISTLGPTTIGRLRDGAVTVETFTPEVLKLPCPKPAALAVKDAADSAALILRVLNGERGAPRDIVALNAAATAIVAGEAADWQAGFAMATQSIDSGAALKALQTLTRISQAERA